LSFGSQRIGCGYVALLQTQQDCLTFAELLLSCLNS